MALRILLVDDQVTTRRIVRFNLEQFGFEVLEATDGVHAWEILQNEQIHLLVTDESMPRLSGLALCEKIRHAPHLADMSIILISGTVPSPRREVLERLSISHYFPKPFSPREVVDKVCETLWAKHCAAGVVAAK